MKIIPLVCPECNANLSIEPKGDFAFCQYCGAKLILEQENIHKIKIDNRDTIDNYLKRAKKFLAEGEKEKARAYYDKVLDLDADNEEANEALRTIIVKSNVLLQRKNHMQSAARRFQYYIDGICVASLCNGERIPLMVPCGNHTLKVEGPGVKSGSTQFEIESSVTTLEIVVSIKLGWKNTFIFEIKNI